MTQSVRPLRVQAETLAANLPPLLVQAERLANTVMLGDHGRRRAGMGDTFWQYRAAEAGDDARRIDWRRSAKTDTQYVQDKEWQIAQSVQMWIDTAASMNFASTKALTTKGERAKVLAMAVSILLLRAGERVGLTGTGLPVRSGLSQINRMAEALAAKNTDDICAPDTSGMVTHSRALFISDFLGPIEPVQEAMTKAADRGVKGIMLQVLDPSEEEFPFTGRTVFHSIGDTLEHETLHAGELRDRYLARLEDRKNMLDALMRAIGWRFATHRTDASAASILLWLHRTIEGPRR